MNKSMILELVADGKCYFDNINLYKIKEFTEHNEELNIILEEFYDGMAEEKKRDIMCKFDTAHGGIVAITAEEYFKEGFKLGLILAAQNFLE